MSEIQVIWKVCIFHTIMHDHDKGRWIIASVNPEISNKTKKNMIVLLNYTLWWLNKHVHIIYIRAHIKSRSQIVSKKQNELNIAFWLTNDKIEQQQQINSATLIELMWCDIVFSSDIVCSCICRIGFVLSKINRNLNSSIVFFYYSLPLDKVTHKNSSRHKLTNRKIDVKLIKFVNFIEYMYTVSCFCCLFADWSVCIYLFYFWRMVSKVSISVLKSSIDCLVILCF